MAELTFYDSLVAVAASEGARRTAAWIIRREFRPPEWTGDERMDLVVSRLSRGEEVWVNAAELKWWRAADARNRANRRKELVTDLLRAANVHGFIGVEESAYVVLVSTKSSWDSTTNVAAGAGDAEVGAKLRETGSVGWPLRALDTAPAIRGAAVALRHSMQLPSSFRTELVRKLAVPVGGGEKVIARVWEVRKPQRSTVLTDQELSALFP
jgi:hypothetical protein